jgi:hypothetical protein
MIVSNFELLVKRIAPLAPGATTAQRAVSRRSVQAYFLTITNLENRSIDMTFSLTINQATGNKVIGGNNVLCFFDNGGVGNPPLTITQRTPTANTIIYDSGSITLAPKQTGLVVISPNVGLFLSNPNPDLEIRGFVELKQSFSFRGKPEAKVLVTPELRGIFLDDDYPAATSASRLDFDQVSSAIVPASGKTENLLAEVPGLILPFPFPFPKPFPIFDLEKLRSSNPLWSEQDLSGIAKKVSDANEMIEFFSKEK